MKQIESLRFATLMQIEHQSNHRLNDNMALTIWWKVESPFGVLQDILLKGTISYQTNITALSKPNTS